LKKKQKQGINKKKNHQIWGNMIDKAEFIHSVTFAACSSMDIRDTLKNTFSIIKSCIPLDSMHLSVYDEENELVNKLYMDEKNGLISGLQMPIQREHIKYLDEKEYDYTIFDSNSKNFIDKRLAENHKKAGNSDIVVRLKDINGRRIGFLVLTANKKNAYDDSVLDLIKGIDVPFALALDNALKHEEFLSDYNQLQEENIFLKSQITDKNKPNYVMLPGIEEIFKNAKAVASYNNTILITGETGTGKEVLANFIHENSQVKDGPFVKVNCGAIPENLVDSELFGREKGAYTGAVQSAKGRFEHAHNGTIFLDEIGELPLDIQTRLLRVLQFKEIERLGSSKPISVNVRIIAATHRDLEAMVKRGEFREDLWYRLNVFPLHMPPLRERSSDVYSLAKFIIKKKCRELGTKDIPDIDQRIVDQIVTYSWPGNIREMENIIEREIILSQGKPLTFRCITDIDEKQKTESSGGNGSIVLDDVIREHIKKVLVMSKGKISGKNGAAEMLGLHPNTLGNKMKKLGIQK